MMHIDTREFIDKLDTNGFNCFDYRENKDGYVCIDVSDDKHPNRVVIVGYDIPEEDMMVVDKNGICTDDYDNPNINVITKSETIKFDDRLKQAVASAINSDNNVELIVRITSEDKDITSTTNIGDIIAGCIFDNVEWN